jgi:hypothetical protein
MMGKSLLREDPLLVGLLLVAFIFLGVLPGQVVSKYLKKAPPELWVFPGRIDKSLPLPIEQAASPVQRMWILFLPATVLAHHYLLPDTERAFVSSLWLKGLITLFAVAFAWSVLTARLRYEIRR